MWSCNIYNVLQTMKYMVI